MRCFLATMLLLVGVSTVSAQATVPGWHDNLDQARKVAERDGKPLLVVFRCVR